MFDKTKERVLQPIKTATQIAYAALAIAVFAFIVALAR